MGNRDDLKEPNFFPEECDFICFTDNSLSSCAWKVLQIDPFYNDPCRNAKIYKILPHRYLSEYEYHVWMDGNIVLQGDVNFLIKKYLANKDIAFFRHPEGRNCIYEEAEICISLNKDDPLIIRSQMASYREEGYPEKNGLVACTVILRRNTPRVNKNNEDWWEELERHSKRDQLSFNYVAHKNKLSYSVIDENVRDNPYFKMLPHKKKKRGFRFRDLWHWR